MINIETFDQQELNEINKSGRIKKVEFINEKPVENIKIDEGLEPPTDKNYDDYIIQSVEKVDKNMERIDIINSEKLSTLLSSKKKDRYKNVIDSMDGIEKETVGQQINFYEQQYDQVEEKENINNDSRISIIDGSVYEAECEGEISANHNSIEPKPDISILTSNSGYIDKNESIPTINHETESPVEKAKYNFYQEFDIHKDQNIIIESLTHEQEVQEQNDVIVNNNDDKQTVIDCTQSDEQVKDDKTSDRNIIADEFSLEYAASHHKIESSNRTPQDSIKVDYCDQSMNEPKNYKAE